jgi:hypothetical protein
LNDPKKKDLRKKVAKTPVVSWAIFLHNACKTKSEGKYVVDMAEIKICRFLRDSMRN